MNKIINNKIINVSLLAFAIVAFGFSSFPAKASAQYTYSGYTQCNGSGNNYYGGTCDTSTSPATNYNNGGYYYNQPTYQAPVYTQPAPAPAPTTTTTTIYSNGSSNDSASNNHKTTTTTVSKNTTTTDYTLAYVPTSIMKSIGAIRAANTTVVTPVNTLTANALYTGFMPHSIIGWIFFIILILLIVILVRKVFGAADTYNSTPLKHE